MKVDMRLLNVQKLLHNQHAEGKISEGAIRDIDSLVKEAARQETSWNVIWKPLLQSAGIIITVAAITVLVIRTFGTA